MPRRGACGPWWAVMTGGIMRPRVADIASLSHREAADTCITKGLLLTVWPAMDDGVENGEYAM